MKKNYLKLLFLTCAAVTMTHFAQAQAFLENPNYGSNKEERTKTVENLNFFRDAYDNKDYGRAVAIMQDLIKIAPKASENLYIQGANIYNNKIARAKSVVEKNTMIDSLMIMYDLRMEHFGDHPKRGKGYIIGLKTEDYMVNKPNDREGIQKLINEVVELNGDYTDPRLINLYFSSLVEGYKADAVETDVLMNEYDRLDKILTTCVSPEKDEAKKTFDALFISSGAANCENLEMVMRPKVAANPTDIPTLEKAFSLLSNNNCFSDFQMEVGVALYKANPTSQIALFLASAFENKNDNANAKKYLAEAMNTESDATMKANLLLRIAGVDLKDKQYQAAAQAAKQAIDINPTSGPAYLILANAYAVGSSSSCGDFAQEAVNWLIYDVASKARELLSGQEDLQKSAETLMNGSRARFPSNESCFHRELYSGNAYNVNCGWISGRTTVRPR